MAEVTDNKYYIDEYGRAYLYKKTADLVREAEHLSRESTYEELPQNAAISSNMAVGYILMAEELEPHNPNVLESMGFIVDLSKKSNDYMLALTERIIYKIDSDESNKYPEFHTSGWFKKVLPKIKTSLEKDIKQGKMYRWI